MPRLLRRLAPFLVIPLVLGLEGLAWYGVRSVLWAFLLDVGQYDSLGVGSTMSTLFVLSAGGAILGGLVAVLVGPWALLPLCLALLGGALLALPLFPPELFWLPLALASLGYGAARPAAYALVAVELAAPRENLRSAAMLLVYGAVNLGAALAAVGASATLDRIGFTTVFSLAGAVALVGALVAVVPGVLALLDRSEPEPGDRARALHLPSLGAAAGLLAVCLLPVALLFHGTEHTYRALFDLESPELYYSLNPLVVSILALVLAAGFIALHFAWGRALPALAVAGIGLVLMAVGVAVGGSAGGFAGGSAGGSPSLVLVALLVTSVGEVVAIPLLVARLVGDLHWRLVALVAGLWTGLLGALGWLLGWISTVAPGLESMDTALLWTGVVLGAALGVALVAAAFPLQARVYAVSPEPEGA